MTSVAAEAASAAERHERALAAALAERDRLRALGKRRPAGTSSGAANGEAASTAVSASAGGGVGVGTEARSEEECAEIRKRQQALLNLRKTLGSCAAANSSSPHPCTASEPHFPWMHSPMTKSGSPTAGELCSRDKILDVGCGDGRALICAASGGHGHRLRDTGRSCAGGAQLAREAGQEVESLVRVICLNAIEVIDTALADAVTFPIFLFDAPRQREAATLHESMSAQASGGHLPASAPGAPEERRGGPALPEDLV